MSSSLRRPTLPIAAAVALASASILTLTAGSSGAAPTVLAYECTGAPETFTVPADVTSITVEATGGAGGVGWNESLNDEDAVETPGGLGGGAAATIAVEPGDEVTVTVGCAGDDVAVDTGNGITDAGPGAGGYGGSPGGDGGLGGDFGSGGGGGGTSDIRINGTSLADRVLVAAGGGGSGGIGTGTASVGGDGGGAAGSGGAAGDGDGGSGGTPSAGGAGGGTNGSAGTDAAGGEGGDGDSYGAGGGGGGGWFGGGGGEGQTEGGGGGGGSSYAAPGSTGVTLSSGVQAGDGTVTITYEAEPAVAPIDQPAAPVPAAPVAADPDFTG